VADKTSDTDMLHFNDAYWMALKNLFLESAGKVSDTEITQKLEEWDGFREKLQVEMERIIASFVKWKEDTKFSNTDTHLNIVVADKLWRKTAQYFEGMQNWQETGLLEKACSFWFSSIQEITAAVFGGLFNKQVFLKDWGFIASKSKSSRTSLGALKETEKNLRIGLLDLARKYFNAHKKLFISSEHSAAMTACQAFLLTEWDDLAAYELSQGEEKPAYLYTGPGGPLAKLLKEQLNLNFITYEWQKTSALENQHILGTSPDSQVLYFKPLEHPENSPPEAYSRDSSANTSIGSAVTPPNSVENSDEEKGASPKLPEQSNTGTALLSQNNFLSNHPPEARSKRLRERPHSSQLSASPNKAESIAIVAGIFAGEMMKQYSGKELQTTFGTFMNKVLASHDTSTESSEELNTSPPRLD